MIFYFQDVHGNTALHIAVKLGHFECVKLLIDANALLVKIWGHKRWDVLNEAISYGNRKISRFLQFYSDDFEE